MRSFNLLCLIKDVNNQSICKSGDVLHLSNIVKTVYLDPPSTKTYNFSNNPPPLNGQIGVPRVVDRILGKQFYYEILGHFWYDGKDIAKSGV